jgi:hypothetical protein
VRVSHFKLPSIAPHEPPLKCLEVLTSFVPIGRTINLRKGPMQLRCVLAVPAARLALPVGPDGGACGRCGVAVAISSSEAPPPTIDTHAGEPRGSRRRF